MIRMSWKVYGYNGHRQRESFGTSVYWDFTNEYDGTRIIEIEREDKTHTNDYIIVKITRNSKKLCEDEMEGQVSDGIFENSRVGKIILLECEEV